MFRLKSIEVYLCAFALLVFQKSYSDTPVFPVVGEYESSSQSNMVDASAAYFAANSTGLGQDEALVTSIEQFRDDIRQAFSKSCGGVINFDNGLIAGGTQTDQFEATFGEGKSLIVNSADHLRTDFDATAICLPVSGPGAAPSGGFLAKSNVKGDQITRQCNYILTFTESGFAPDEHVLAVGGTILGRNGCPDKARWFMKVSLDNGDIIAQIAEIDFREGRSTSDTFFGAKAPQGRYITGVSWINLSGGYSGLDSLAFITNGSPPKKNTSSANTTSDYFSSDTYGGSQSGTSGGYSLFGRDRQ